MHTISAKPHRVERTLGGRFAVIRPDGSTVATVIDPALALMCAAQLDAEPVRTTEVQADGEGVGTGRKECAVQPLGRWDQSLAA